MLAFACRPSDGQSNKKEGENGQNSTIDSDLWKMTERGTYPYRPGMLDALVYTDTIRKLRKDSVLMLLGPADRFNDNHYYYSISKNQPGNWSLNEKTMVVKIDEQGHVAWIKIHG